MIVGDGQRNGPLSTTRSDDDYDDDNNDGSYMLVDLAAVVVSSTNLTCRRRSSVVTKLAACSTLTQICKIWSEIWRLPQKTLVAPKKSKF